MLVWAKARLFGRTPREIREWTKPPKFDYAVYVGTKAYRKAKNAQTETIVCLIDRQQFADRRSGTYLCTLGASSPSPGRFRLLRVIHDLQATAAVRRCDWTRIRRPYVASCYQQDAHLSSLPTR